MTKLWIAVLLACGGAGACAAPTAAPERAPDHPLAAAATDWSTQVIYLALADRFRDGDPSNDTAAGSCFDPADPHGYHGGDFAGLAANLDYLQRVGATALWITPPNVQAGPAGQCGYHGYWIDYTDPPDDALAPSLGTPDELAALSADLHAAGMRFVLDMVVNHAGDTARITGQHPDWFHDPATCDSQLTCPLDHHPDFAQENPTVAAYLSALEQRAVTRYAVDGIRMDTAMYVPPSYFEDSFFPAVRAANPNVWSVGEIFDEGSTAQFGAYLDAGFNSAFHYPLYGALAAGIGKSGSVDAIASAVAAAIDNLGAARAQSLVLFVDNHDVPRFANLPGYGVPEDEIRKRLLLAYDLIFTLPGIPALYYGDELGMYGGLDPDNRRDLPTWAMDAAARAEPHPGEAVAGSDIVFARVQLLTELRTTTPALATGAYTELWRQNGAANTNVYAFARGTGTGRDTVITVIGNGDAVSGPVAIPVQLPDGTQLVDELGDGAPATITIANGKLPIALPPRSAAIYSVLQMPG